MSDRNRPPRLALCVPAYNAGAFLPSLLGSAQNQQVSFDEILIYDDCSTDDTAEIARSFGAKVVQGDRNVGCSAGKNRLLQETDCDWIHYHDADDDLLPDFTKLAHQWMAREDCPDVVLFDYESRRYEDGTFLSTRRFDPEALGRDPRRYAIRNQINPYCGLYRRCALQKTGGYDEDPRVLYNEDCRFHMRLAFAGLSFGVEPKIAVVNLERLGSMSGANRAKCAVARLSVLEKALAETGQENIRDIGLELWLCARHLGSYGLWDDMAGAIRLARGTGIRFPIEERSLLVRILSRFAPVTTFRLRAAFVKLRISKFRRIL